MDKFSCLPMELKLYIWEILKVLIAKDRHPRFNLKAECYGRLMLVNQEWFHFFAPYIYQNEVQLATVLSNNLNDKSKANIKRIEELYSRYVTTIDSYIHNNGIFWEFLDAFNYDIGFPNLKILKMDIHWRLPVSPRMPVTHNLDKLILYQGGLGTKYRDLKKFCNQIKRSGISIDTIDLSTSKDKVKFLATCQPALYCNVRKIDHNGQFDTRQLELLATSETCKSLRFIYMTNPLRMSPAAEAFIQRLTFLDLRLEYLGMFYKMESNKQVTLPNLRHLCIITSIPWDLAQAALIPVVCPNIEILSCDSIGITEKDGEIFARAFNDFDASFSAKINRLKIRAGTFTSVAEQCICKIDWSRYPNISRLELWNNTIKNNDRLRELVRRHAPFIKDVVLTSEW